MNTKINRMLIRTVSFLSVLITLCLCLNSDVSFDRVQALLLYETEQSEVTPGEEDVRVNVNMSEPLNHIEEYFVSFNIDCQEFSEHFEKMNFSSAKLHTLLHAMSPAILRVGGSPADWLFFDKPLSVLQAAGLQPNVTVATKQDVANLVKLTQSTGNRLLFDVNLQLRFGQQWNPSNAIELFEFCANQGFCDNIDWELGNEPSVYGSQQVILSPEQIAQDFVIFHRVLESYPCFSKSSVVGPDIFPVRYIPEGQTMIQAVANSSGEFLRAITFHHYYFRGDTASYKEYLNPDHFQYLADTIDLVQSTVAGSKYPELAIWIGETSDAWHSGTANVSDRFVSGFLWLDKLGFSAQKGIGVVMRQTLYGYYYALLDTDMNPNPDYWLSLLHRRLVGSTVLHVHLNNAPNTTRVYAHCTRAGGLYKRGAVTVFALNISPTDTTHLVFEQSTLHQQPIDVYMLSPYEGILSKYVMLNAKQRLMMPSDTELPTLEPIHLEPGSKVTLSPLTFGFFVFPEANVKICDL